MRLARKELKNTYNLPSGAPLKKVLVKFFREQRKAFQSWLEAEQRKFAPFQLDRRVLIECKLFPPAKFPGWEPLGLGAKVLQKRIMPVLTKIWKDSGTKALDRLREKKIQRKDMSFEFDVTNPKVKQAIEEAALKFSQETNDTTSMDIEDALARLREDLAEGMESGDTIAEIADSVKEIFDKAEDFRAERIATTETSRAYHQAQMMADEESGVVPGYQWLASEDACDEICQAIVEQAEFIKAGTPFAIIDDNSDYGTIYAPPAHPNCCLPDTPIVAPLKVAGVEAHYSGPVVRLRFDDGTEFTVTPNHMLLAPDGFVCVSSLMEGDDVIRYRGPIERMPVGDPEDNDIPATIQQVVNSLAESNGSVTCDVLAATEHLHNDGTFCQGNIRVVSANGFLRKCCDPKRLEMIVKADLVSSKASGLHLSDYRSLVRVLFSLFYASAGRSGLERESHAFARAQLRHANDLSFNPVPSFDSCLSESVFNHSSGYSEILRDRMLGLPAQVEINDLVSAHRPFLDPSSRLSLPNLHGHACLNKAVAESVRSHANRISQVANRFSSLITTCKVADVEFSHYSGPVYDVQTIPTLYLIGHGIVSSNCQCTYVEVLDTDDPQPDWGETYIAPPKTGKSKNFTVGSWKHNESLLEVGVRVLEAIEAKFNPNHDPSTGQFASGEGGDADEPSPEGAQYHEMSPEDVVDDHIMASVPYEPWQDHADEIYEWRDEAVDEIDAMHSEKEDVLKGLASDQRDERKNLRDDQRDELASLKDDYSADVIKEEVLDKVNDFLDARLQDRLNKDMTSEERQAAQAADKEAAKAYARQVKEDLKKEYADKKATLEAEHAKQRDDMIGKQKQEIVNETNAQDKALADTVSKLKGDFAKLIDDLRGQYTDNTGEKSFSISEMIEAKIQSS